MSDTEREAEKPEELSFVPNEELLFAPEMMAEDHEAAERERMTIWQCPQCLTIFPSKLARKTLRQERAADGARHDVWRCPQCQGDFPREEVEKSLRDTVER